MNCNNFWQESHTPDNSTKQTKIAKMKIEITQDSNTTIIAIEGRLDTVTASEFENAVRSHLSTKELELIVDCSAMEYISSAGLRVVLIAHKSITANGGRFVVRNLASEVRSVFDLTGFSRILTIE